VAVCLTFPPPLPPPPCVCGHVQDGVFRTNCIDCLDRTNVVQGLLARHALEDLLAELGVLQQGEGLATALPQVGGGVCMCGRGVMQGEGLAAAWPQVRGEERVGGDLCLFVLRGVDTGGGARYSTATCEGGGQGGLHSGAGVQGLWWWYGGWSLSSSSSSSRQPQAPSLSTHAALSVAISVPLLQLPVIAGVLCMIEVASQRLVGARSPLLQTDCSVTTAATAAATAAVG